MAVRLKESSLYAAFNLWFFLSKKNRLTENFKKEDIIKISEISSDYISFNQEEKKRVKK